jgi:hypothetical protein
MTSIAGEAGRCACRVRIALGARAALSARLASPGHEAAWLGI